MAAFAPPVAGWPGTGRPSSVGRRRASAASGAHPAAMGRLRMNGAGGGGGAPPVTVSRLGVEVHHFAPAVEALENEGKLAGPALPALSMLWGVTVCASEDFSSNACGSVAVCSAWRATVMTTGCATVLLPVLSSRFRSPW